MKYPLLFIVLLVGCGRAPTSQRVSPVTPAETAQKQDSTPRINATSKEALKASLNAIREENEKDLVFLNMTGAMIATGGLTAEILNKPSESDAPNREIEDIFSVECFRPLHGKTYEEVCLIYETFMQKSLADPVIRKKILGSP